MRQTPPIDDTTGLVPVRLIEHYAYDAHFRRTVDVEQPHPIALDGD